MGGGGVKKENGRTWKDLKGRGGGGEVREKKPGGKVAYALKRGKEKNDRKRKIQEGAREKGHSTPKRS